MPRRWVPMKDVAKLRKAEGSGVHALILRSPNGATPPAWRVTAPYVVRREPGELKHLTYPEEEQADP